MRNGSGRRWGGSHLVWIGGLAAGLVAGGLVAYSLTNLGTAVTAPRHR